MTLYDLTKRPDLDHPVLIVALEGWIDAGAGAETARDILLDQLDTRLVATFDTDTLLDYRARRPIMHLHDGVNTGLTWSSIELHAATDRSGNDLLILAGVEPDHAWKQFCREVVDLAVELGARLLCGIGAYPAAVPHTRPTMLSATASDDDLAAAVGLIRGSIDVPAGVEAALEEECKRVGLPAVGLWAQVPHYASAMSFPGASLALLEGLERVAQLEFAHGDLVSETATTKTRLDSLVADSEEHLEMVRQLEAHADQLRADGGDRLPSGDELAAELQRFLREQGD
ncbi:MAG TPA: PAC2 family protein [Acidimicrobiales bacterium]|nr:PAC2 family protein [Acidimicrobiales bacterium]